MFPSIGNHAPKPWEHDYQCLGAKLSGHGNNHEKVLPKIISISVNIESYVLVAVFAYRNVSRIMI